jgi:hypothetical protein
MQHRRRTVTLECGLGSCAGEAGETGRVMAHSDHCNDRLATFWEEPCPMTNDFATHAPSIGRSLSGLAEPAAVTVKGSVAKCPLPGLMDARRDTAVANGVQPV